VSPRWVAESDGANVWGLSVVVEALDEGTARALGRHAAAAAYPDATLGPVIWSEEVGTHRYEVVLRDLTDYGSGLEDFAI